MKSLNVFRDLLPAHLGAGAIAVLIVCGLILAGYAASAVLKWRWRRSMRRHGWGPW